MSSSDEFWNSYHNKLLSFIRKRVNSDDAEDILHEVFIKVHENVDSLREREKLESWLYQITRNAIADYFRKNKPASDLPEWVSIDDIDSQADEVRKELSLCLLPMIDQLPEKYRSALYASEIEGAPQSVVALSEGMSISGAKSRIQRGRHLLKDMLNRCCEIEINNKNQLVSYRPKGGGCGSC